MSGKFAALRIVRRGLRVVLYAAVGVAVLVAESLQRDANFVLGKLILLSTGQNDGLAKLSWKDKKERDKKTRRKESDRLCKRAYPIRNHLVNSPPRAPESHDLFGLGIVGQIVNHLGIVYLFIRRLVSSRAGVYAIRNLTKGSKGCVLS